MGCLVALSSCKTPEQKCGGHGADALVACTALCDQRSSYGCSSAAGKYLMGDGAPESDAKYAEYAQRACDLDDFSECYALGTLYKIGSHVPKDLSKAAVLLQKACSLGEQEACAAAKTLGSSTPGK